VTVTVFRIVKDTWNSGVFDGEGAKRYPGRWNSRGIPMVYTASSRALAMLEILVDFDAEDLVRKHFQVFPVTVPDHCILELGVALPRDWQAYPAPISTKAIGDNWIKNQASAVLAVPSATIPAEQNYLINPEHPDFSKLVIGPAQTINFDPRLAK
jgi:RES domain-containing protein